MNIVGIYGETYKKPSEPFITWKDIYDPFSNGHGFSTFPWDLDLAHGTKLFSIILAQITTNVYLIPKFQFSVK